MSINDASPEGGNTTRPVRDALDSELSRTSVDGDGNNVLRLIARKLAAKAGRPRRHQGNLRPHRRQAGRGQRA